jgi:hypothetical protein
MGQTTDIDPNVRVLSEPTEPGSLQARLVADLRAELGAAWTKLTEVDRTNLTLICGDAATLQIQALAAGGDERKIAWVEREKKHLAAQLASIQSIAESGAAEVFWKVFDRLSLAGVKALTAIAAAAI